MIRGCQIANLPLLYSRCLGYTLIFSIMIFFSENLSPYLFQIFLYYFFDFLIFKYNKNEEIYLFLVPATAETVFFATKNTFMQDFGFEIENLKKF